MFTEQLTNLLKDHPPLQQTFESINHYREQYLNNFQKLTKENLNLLSKQFDSLSEQTSRLTAAKNPTDVVLVLQSCFTDNMQSAIENGQNIMHNSLEFMQNGLNICGNCSQSVGKANSPKHKSAK
jgi:alpha-D-ribose 1-methylphosphonate 5-triphosphate diphosphatase PhnM